jgi:O-antigen/teichoic acid export membrane protein
MIDRRLGQDLLGVWDFAWSLVTYFGLVAAGVASSVNRYVARYRMAGDISGVNAVVSSACCIMAISGLLAMGLTITLSVLMPHLFGARVGENVREAQWVVFLLGASMAVEIAFQAYNGVLTGCHRWGLRNLIDSGWHAVTIAGMIVALVRGGGLRTLSLIYLIGIVLAYATRMVFAYRVCDGLKVRLSLVRWATIKEQFVFGGKTLIPNVSQLLLNQTVSVLIAATLGPAALALYARPRSLVLHANTLVKKMALVLIPTISSLQSRGDLEGVRELLTSAVRYSCYLALPITLVLVIFGGPIMVFWMGPRYGDGWLPAILATGFLVTMVQTPVWPILVGLNAHGRAGIAELLASLCSALLIVLGLGVFNWGLLAVALGVCVPLTIMNAVYLPIFMRRRIGLNIGRYFRSIAVAPVVHVLPFVACLVVSRLVWSARPLIGMAVGGAAGAVVLAVPYWRYVLPDRIKDWVLHHLRRVLRLIGSAVGTDTAL